MANFSFWQWNSQGILPPFDKTRPTSTKRSPYSVSLEEFIITFGISSERMNILKGYIQHRSKLHGIGLIQGFQWIDGSFMENVELIEKRSPQDIDVVTFFRLPEGKTQMEIYQNYLTLFDRELAKQNFNVDAFFVHLDNQCPELLIKLAAYWYSLWSHRRNGQWKGFLELDLSPVNEAKLLGRLDELAEKEANHEL